jgi:hypothetical protein
MNHKSPISSEFYSKNLKTSSSSVESKVPTTTSTVSPHLVNRVTNKDIMTNSKKISFSIDSLVNGSPSSQDKESKKSPPLTMIVEEKDRSRFEDRSSSPRSPPNNMSRQSPPNPPSKHQHLINNNPFNSSPSSSPLSQLNNQLSNQLQHQRMLLNQSPVNQFPQSHQPHPHLSPHPQNNPFFRPGFPLNPMLRPGMNGLESPAFYPWIMAQRQAVAAAAFHPFAGEFIVIGKKPLTLQTN